MAAPTDWHALATLLTRPHKPDWDALFKIGDTGPEQPTPSLDMRASSAAVTTPRPHLAVASPVSPSIDWALVGIWLGGLVFCVVVLVLVGLAIWLVA